MIAFALFESTIKLNLSYPPGKVVYHKSTGEKGSIVGYVTYADSSSRLLVDFSPRAPYEFLMPTSLTTTPPALPPDEAWKQTV